MTIREIPRSFVYTCDGCSTEHVQENAGGHYTESTPPHWSKLALRRMAWDGNTAVGDNSTVMLLCARCTEKAEKLMHGLTGKK